MTTPMTPAGRQMVRDQRDSRIERIEALSRTVRLCIETKNYDAALVMGFIQLDTWAFLSRPESMVDHGRTSFKLFIERYLQDAPGQGYSYKWLDVYAARCALLHTFGSQADLHNSNSSVVLWRYHLGKQNTFVPGLTRMAYISVQRLLLDANAAVGRCMAEMHTDHTLKKRIGDRLPRVYFLAGVLPSRDPDAIAAMDPALDAEIASWEGEVSGR
jgi:hypothetical protein